MEVLRLEKAIVSFFNDNIYKDNVEEFWKDKPVRFAQNNCIVF